MNDAMTVGAALAQSGLIPLDASVLLAHVLDRDRSWLISHADEALERTACDVFFALAKRRRRGEPVAYLTGRREFWGMLLAVSPDVLIPRPETETLVEMALARMPMNRPLRVLDLGTGSGAIALAIAKTRPAADVVALDQSAAALIVARSNGQRHELERVRFAQSDWYSAVAGQCFDLIVSNPPYVAGRDSHLLEGDVRHEPRAALTPGDEGLAALRTIIGAAPEHLADDGHLLVEHGYDQGAAVRQLFIDAGFSGLVAQRDLAGIPRVVAGQLIRT
jgi:release factor glutamine methyltransferase